MKIHNQRFGHRLITFCLTIQLLITGLSASAAEPKQVALIPFKINADRDLAYLRDGIYDMLSTRLSRSGEVVVLQREQVEQAVNAAGRPDAQLDEPAARSIGRTLAADFVMIGSLTVLGSNVSIDAKMIDVAGTRPTMAFSEQSEDLGGVITKVNMMASEINAALFGGAVVSAAPQVSPPQAQPQPPGQTHPEKILRESGGRPDEGGGSPFIVEDRALGAGGGFWKSQSFKEPINGLTLGDVNKDGKMETVVLLPHAVIVYAIAEGRFYKVAELEEDSSHILIGVDVADINANGTPEIFVTSLEATRQRLNSYVLEFDGKNFVTIVKDSRWYFRVVEPSARGSILLGQEHRQTNVFSGSLYELTWQGGEYRLQDQVRTPSGLSVLGVAMGEILDDRQEYMVAYMENDHLQLIDGAGKSVWTGSERVGGNSLYYVPPKEIRGEVAGRRYYPSRIRVYRPADSGKPQVLVARNFELAGMKLEQFRKFTDGQIEALEWDGLGLALAWRTRKISGFIRDFAVGDFDNDGTLELVLAVVANEGEAVWSAAKSNIIAYDLVLPEKAE